MSVAIVHQFHSMLHIQLIQVGKTKDAYFKDAEDEYLKRLLRFAKVKVDTVDDDSKIPGRIQKDSFVIALEIKGKQMSSEEFSQVLKDASVRGKITFIVGGPHGLPEDISEKSDLQLSFSKMTFTHQMIRVFLLEQIYRGLTILEGKKYHY